MQARERKRGRESVGKKEQERGGQERRKREREAEMVGLYGNEKLAKGKP